MKLKPSNRIIRVRDERLKDENRARNEFALPATRIRRKCVDFAVNTRTMGDVAVVHCGGKLIFQKEAEALCEVVTGLVQRFRSVVLDLQGVGAIDGSGVGTLAD